MSYSTRMNIPLRTDSEFRSVVDESYHNGKSIIKDISGIDYDQ